jgi:hypothetical protein
VKAYVVADANASNMSSWLRRLDLGAIAGDKPYNEAQTAIMELNLVNDLLDLLLLAKNLHRLVLPKADIEIDVEYRPRCAGAIAIASRQCTNSLRELSMLAEFIPRGEVSLVHIGRFQRLESLELAFWGNPEKCEWLKSVPAWTMPELRKLHWKGPGLGLSFLRRCSFEKLERLSLEVCELYDDVEHMVEVIRKHPQITTLSLDGMDYPEPETFMGVVKASTFMIVPSLLAPSYVEELYIDKLAPATRVVHFVIKDQDYDLEPLYRCLAEFAKVKTSVKEIRVRHKWLEIEPGRVDPFGVKPYACKLKKAGITLFDPFGEVIGSTRVTERVQSARRH